jgi:hypothetical protein
MSTNRREFLKRSGGLAVTGWVGASGLAAATGLASPKPQASTAGTARPSSVESWLLETGRHELDDAVYHAVADGRC